MTESLRFADHTYDEIAALPRESAALILPVGSTEPHGPHLPLSTDVIISEGMAQRAAGLLASRGLRALVLPPILYSVTDFARGFSGAMSLRFETARDLMIDVLTGAIRDGFRMVCVANSHLEPRHVETIYDAIRRVTEETGVPIAFPDKRRRKMAQLLGDEFVSGACHAGQYETSLVMMDRPELVRDDVRLTLPSVDQSLSVAIGNGTATFLEAGGDRAYFGRPAAASRDEGAKTFEVLARMLVQSIEETYGLAGLQD